MELWQASACCVIVASVCRAVFVSFWAETVRCRRVGVCNTAFLRFSLAFVVNLIANCVTNGMLTSSGLCTELMAVRSTERLPNVESRVKDLR